MNANRARVSDVRALANAAPHLDSLHGIVGGNYQGLHSPALSLALDALYSASNELSVVAMALAAEENGESATFASVISAIAERLGSLAVICHEEDGDKVPGDNGPGFKRGGAQ